MADRRSNRIRVLNGTRPGRRQFLQTGVGIIGGGLIATSASDPVRASDTENQVVDEDWPMFGYDAANTGYSPDETGPSNLDKIWRFETDFEIQSSPVVSDGTAYIGSEDRQFYAIDIETGELDWKFEVGESIESAAAILQNRVFVPTRSDKIYALDKNTGEEIWSKDVRHIRTGITAANGRIFYTVANRLIARDTSDGELLWEVNAYHSGHSGPAFANGSVYFGTSEGKLYSIDAENGSEEWIFRAFDWMGTPTVVGNTVYVGSSDDHVYAVDTETGTEIWNYELGKTARNAPAVADDIVYVVGGRTLVALDTEEGTEIWTNSLERRSRASPALAGGKTYVSSRNTLHVFDKADGEELSSFETEDRIEASPAIASDTVFVGSTDNSLYALSDDDVQVTTSKFEVTLQSIEKEVVAGEQVNIEFNVENTGDVTDIQEIVFEVDREQVDVVEEVELDGGATFNSTFFYETVEEDRPEITVSISTDDDKASFEIAVLEAEDEEEDSGDEEGEDTTTPSDDDAMDTQEEGDLDPQEEDDGQIVDEEIPGFSVVSALTGLGGTAYLLKHRLLGKDTDE